jgi:hypothetical protein
VPTTATAVALNVTVTDTTVSSYLTVYPAGGTLPLVSNLNWVSGEAVPNLVIVPVGSGGQVTFYNDLGRTDLVVDVEGYFAPEPSGTTAGSYVPLTPSRITDTRAGSGEPNAGQTLDPVSTLNVQVTGAGGVPASGVTAALLNVTVTDTTSASYLTVYPQGETQPLASNLNWVGGDTVPNRVVVPVSSTGMITLYNYTGRTDVVVDVDGYFTDGTVTPTTASLFSPISPVRVLDTRQTGQTLGPGGTLPQEMAGVDGIASNANAVVTNVTATNTTAPSYFTVYPGGTQPLASDLNWSAGQTVPNLTLATLSSSGSISIYNHAGSADLVVDAFGYFSPESPTSLTVTTTSLPGATEEVAYSTTLAASGGTAPYSWTITSGSLPTGLSLSSSGVITGTPSAAGTVSFTVQVTDSTTPTRQTGTAPLSLTVATTTTPLIITTTSLPSATEEVAYSTTLAASGGTAPYSWAITSGSLPTGLSLSPTGVISGTPSALGSSSFSVKVTDSTTPTPETATASLSLTVLPAQSGNWSGYVVGSGPYTAVTGTFVVPSLYTGQTGTAMAEWVGIDGDTNSSLIQAGIDEYPDPSDSSLFYIVPWWEILPAAETVITTFTSPVAPSDSVTVTIYQVSGTLWDITLTDNTTGDSFSTEPTYSGPDSSAEWIVEAPTDGNTDTVYPLADYTPTTFSGLESTGSETTQTEIVMVQNGVQVSTPSALTSSGFKVAYGDVAPAAP